MRISPIFLAIVCSLVLAPYGAKAEMSLSSAAQQDIIKSTLVSESAAIQPGKPVHVGVLLEPQPGWHTYWENPGDAGMPTSFKWTLPEGFTASAIEWPAPQRVQEGTLVTYSYHDSVFLPVTITPPASLDSSRSYTLQVKASWLVCKDICIPESAEMSLMLPVSDSMPAPTQNAALFAQHNQHAVQPLAEKVGYRMDSSSVTLSIALPALGVNHVQSAVFFPRQQNVYDYAANEELSQDSGMLHIKMHRSVEPPQDGSSGILTVTLDDGTTKHFDITLSSTASSIAMPAKANAAPAGTTANSEEPVSFLTCLLLAMLGGVVLNLMPCVLPVLSLKTLALVKKAGEAPAKVRKLGIAYTLGIMISFAVIAGTLVALRQTGQAIGWGFQMQSPAFVAFLAYLLFLVGLNLSGMFDLPVLFGNSAAQADDTSVKGSFYTGVLATAVATPCTAPFMATAVGAALSMPAFQAMLVFEALAFGLALPFLLVSFFPALLRFLPKPGAWMERFKQVLAFPMYASVIWLIWVLTLQTSTDGVPIILSGMLMLVITIWLKNFFEIQSVTYRIIAVLMATVILAASLPALERLEGAQGMMPPAGEHEITAAPYSKSALDQLRAQGKPVFLDATAAWCITCQVNARVAIRTKATSQLFKDKGVTLMVADWTRADPAITALLEEFGHKGVPMYIYYPPNNGKPQVLPQLLTEDIIKAAVIP